MIASLINALARHTKETQAIMNEVEEFRALKVEINKVRCVIEFDANGIITFANENSVKSLNYTRASELVTQHHRSLVGRYEANSTSYVQFWEALKRGETPSGVFKLQNNAGEVVWFQGYYAPVMLKGKLSKITAYLTDITREKNKALSLQAEDDGLNAIFAVVELAMDTTILEANDIYLNALGFQRDELVGHHLGYLMHEEDKRNPEFVEMWEKVKQGLVQSGCIRRVSKDKQDVWFQAGFFPVKNIEGKYEKVMCFGTNITEEKNRNLDYEGQLHAIDRVQGIIEFDLNGNVLNVNSNFAKATGYAREEILGRNHSMFMEPEQKNSPDYTLFWEKLARGEAFDGRYKRLGKGGKVVWLQASYNPIFDLEGRPYKIVKYATDISDFVFAQEQAQQSAIEALQIKNTLDSASTNMMVLDNQGYVSYINKSCVALMQSSIMHMRKLSSLFNPDKIVGQRFDVLDKHPATQLHVLNALKQSIMVEMTVGDLFFELKACPIFAPDGSRQGTALEWVDITQERLFENEIADLIENAANGDLNARVNADGKQGVASKLSSGINTLMDKISDVIAMVRDTSVAINTAANEISTGNADLSNRTEQQASSLEETASSMEELSSTVKQNAENAKQANQLAAAASSVAVKGGQVVSEVVNTMSAINDSSRKIEDIIAVIDGIAFQTNILALNAAVEAARAGEQGRGFAVVAGEVRNLAQRSASAAKEIKELITDSVNKTAEGTKLVENAGKTMNEIVSSVQRVTDIMGEISAASAEQSSGIDQVNQAVSSMDEVTQQNAALVEQAAAAAESLVEQANNLMDTVSTFKIEGGGGAYQSQRTSASSSARPKVQAMKASPKPSAKPVSPAPKVAVKTGTDDTGGDWEEF